MRAAVPLTVKFTVSGAVVGPVRANVKAPVSPPSVADASVAVTFTDVCAANTVSTIPFETPLPAAAGFMTATVCVPGLDTSGAGMVADNCVAEPKVVVRAAPSSLTTAPATNPVPATLSVNAPLPATTVAGVSAVTVGALTYISALDGIGAPRYSQMYEVRVLGPPYRPLPGAAKPRGPGSPAPEYEPN